MEKNAFCGKTLFFILHKFHTTKNSKSICENHENHETVVVLSSKIVQGFNIDMYFINSQFDEIVFSEHTVPLLSGTRATPFLCDGRLSCIAQ